MALTAFPNGVSSFGAAVAPGVFGAIDAYWGGGQILWVGNRSGLPAGDGSSPETPLSALFGSTGALAKLNNTTNRGHLILVLPGHAESITGADFASDTGSADSFAIVGLGKGDARGALTWTADASQWIIDTKNVRIDNLRLFMCGAKTTAASVTTLQVAMPIKVTSSGCGIANCDALVGYGSRRYGIVPVQLGSGTSQADRFDLINNRLSWEWTDLTWKNVTYKTGQTVRLNSSDGVRIIGNTMVNYFSHDTVSPCLLLSYTCKGFEIRDNVMFQMHTKGTSRVVARAAAFKHRGWLENNRLYAGTTQGTWQVASNYYFSVQKGPGANYILNKWNYGMSTTGKVFALELGAAQS